MRGLICSAGSAASLAPSLHMTNIEKFQILVLPPLKQRLVCHQKDESGRARAGRRPPLSLSFSILLRPSLLLYISTTKPIRLVCSLSCLPSRISLSGARIRAGGRGGGGHSLDIEKSPRQRAEGGGSLFNVVGRTFAILCPASCPFVCTASLPVSSASSPCF